MSVFEIDMINGPPIDAVIENDQQKLDLIDWFLTSSHLDYHGGYAYPGRWVTKYLYVVATPHDTNSDDFSIQVYRRSDLLRWAKEAIWFRDRNPDCGDWRQPLYETGPPESC